jgi:dihydrofolate synthase/folylpolyglutamate synthase
VIGKSSPETAPVFIEKAKACHSNITFAEPSFPVINYNYQEGMLHINYQNGDEQIHISSVLAGLYQIENIATVLTAVKQLNAINIPISDAATIEGIKEVKKNTGFLGRWEIIRQNPLIICDVAHNEAGLKAIFDQLKSIPHAHLHFVYGMVKDKDIEKALQLLPREATYYFTQPQLPRALDYLSLHEYATNKGLQGNAYPNIAEACAAALVRQKPDNILLISGSIFVVAEALEYFQNMKMYQTN